MNQLYTYTTYADFNTASRLIGHDGNPQQAGYMIERGLPFENASNAQALFEAVKATSEHTSITVDGVTTTPSGAVFANSKTYTKEDDKRHVWVVEQCTLASLPANFTAFQALTYLKRNEWKFEHPFDSNLKRLGTTNYGVQLLEIWTWKYLAKSSYGTIAAFTEANWESLIPVDPNEMTYTFLKREIHEQDDNTLTVEVYFQAETTTDLSLDYDPPNVGTDNTYVSQRDPEFYVTRHIYNRHPTKPTALTSNEVGTLHYQNNGEGLYDGVKEVKTLAESSTYDRWRIENTWTISKVRRRRILLNGTMTDQMRVFHYDVWRLQTTSAVEAGDYVVHVRTSHQHTYDDNTPSYYTTVHAQPGSGVRPQGEHRYVSIAIYQLVYQTPESGYISGDTGWITDTTDPN